MADGAAKAGRLRPGRHLERGVGEAESAQGAASRPKGDRCVGIFPSRLCGQYLSDHTGVGLDFKKV